MTAARKTKATVKIDARTSLAARLDLLLSHTIAIDQFEADVALVYKHEPEEVWTVLALLDQYHRLGKLPTELFRTLKSSADRRGLGRRGSEFAEAVSPPALPVTEEFAPIGDVPTLAAAVPVMPPIVEVTPPTASPTWAIGAMVCHRYLLEAKLDAGLSGALYQALDQQCAGQSVARVALQILDSGGVTAEALAERRQEFADAQRLAHPNVISVRELDHDDQCIVQTMDLVIGEPLSTVLARRLGKALPRATALAIIREIGAALVHAHERGVVHGNLRPDCVVISAVGEVRVRGFGALRANSIYASCEQLENRIADRRDDLYALACISYELLRGTHPFGLLNAATARGRALVPARPMLLTRSQWQTLRIGLAWRRENRTVGVAWWMANMRLTRAAKQLPTLETLAALPPLQRSWLRPLWLAGCLATAVAVASSLDRLPNAKDLSTALSELRGTMASPGKLLSRVGDWLSPQALPAIEVQDKPAGRVAADTKTSSKHGEKIRLAVINRPLAAAAPEATTPTPEVLEAVTATVSAEPIAAPPPTAQVPAPPTQIELSADHYTVLPGESAAHIVVRRHGNLQGDVSFVWWTQGSSATPDRDYVDWGRRAEQIPSGRSSITLLVPVVSDATRTESRVFYVSIGEAGGSAELGENAQAAVLMPGEN